MIHKVSDALTLSCHLLPIDSTIDHLIFYFFFCNLGLRRATHNELRARSVKPLQFLTINLREVTITELQTSRSPFCQPCTFSDCECCSYFCQFGVHFPMWWNCFVYTKTVLWTFYFPCLLISFPCILLNI